MHDWFARIFDFLSEHYRAIGVWATVVGVSMGVIDRWIAIRGYLRLRVLKKRSSARFFASDELRAATDNYLEPRVQESDPAVLQQATALLSMRLFKRMDLLLQQGGFTLLLAETGMGKTAALLNYFARGWSKHARRFELFIVPLRRKTAFADIKEAAKSPSLLPKVLLLDAFDEDTLALPRRGWAEISSAARGARGKRLRELTDAAEGFQHVLITCRTQFFEGDQEVRDGLGEWHRVGSVKMGGSKLAQASVLYISPFSDEETKRYIRSKFPLWRFWRWKQRLDAAKILVLFREMRVRPLILSYIEDLLSLEVPLKYACQAYERIVEAWLEREHGRRADGKGKILDAHKSFCEALAVKIFQERRSRQEWTVTDKELETLAVRFEVSLLDIMDIKVRSLLSRDPQGGIRFAHPSILEYFYITHFRKHLPGVQEVGWTDEMKRFYVEMLFEEWERSEPRTQLRSEEYDLADLSGLRELRISPLRRLRAEPQKFADTIEMIKLPTHFELTGSDRALPHLYEEAEQLPISSVTNYEIKRQVLGATAAYDYWAPVSPDLIVEAVHDILDTLQSVSLIVVDHATGLAWEVGGARNPVRFPLADARAAALSLAGFGGFSAWRLPTIDEIPVLVHIHYALISTSRTNASRPRYLTGVRSKIWTADSVGLSHVVVDLESQMLSWQLHSTAIPICVASLG